MEYKRFDVSHMPYIKDKNVFKAVMFSRSLMRENVSIGLAIYKAAKYYGLETSKVAKYMGKLGSNVREGYEGDDACFDDEQWSAKKSKKRNNK
jgi:hypothetical protein